MSDQHPPEAQRSVRSFLETVGAYVALLIPLVAPPLAYLGVRIGSSDLQWILSACVVFALSIGWLIGRLLKARRAIRDSAPVPKPRWLWQFLVGQLGSSPVELEHAPLLVLVPPGREEEASAIQAAYGSNERVDVISHYLPRSGSRHTDEDEGTTGPSGAERTLKQLSEVAERCAAVLLIDDGQWGTYPETLALINRWGTAHSTRPIITLNVEGLGTLRDYSWMPMTDAVGPTARLVSRILSQAVNRGVMWQEQAGALRTFAFAAVTFLFLVLSASVVLLGIQYQQRTALQTDVKQYQNALTPDAARQRDLALALHQYRNTDSTASSTEFRKLLDAYAEYLQQRMMVTDTAYRTASADVVMFSVSSTQDSTMIREITSTRTSPNPRSFAEARNSPVSWSIVGCAVRQRAFVLWRGSDIAGDFKTRSIKAWTLDGDPARAAYDSATGSLTFSGPGSTHRCEYGVLRQGSVRRSLLCAPVGAAAAEIEPAGALCITTNSDAGALEELWVRHLVQDLGFATAFRNWQVASAGPADSP